MALERMSMKRPSAWRMLLAAFVIAPIAAWAVVKPVRVLAPQWAGVTCVDAKLCLDDPAQLEAARKLYADALGFVAAHVAPVDVSPSVVFCASEACAQSFGLGRRSAVTLGRFGAVIGPKAWQAHYLRHEMIHHLQAERLGTAALLLKPKWFVEGMAYALSEDPRANLDEPHESHRREFMAWFAKIDKARLWQEAGNR